MKTVSQTKEMVELVNHVYLTKQRHKGDGLLVEPFNLTDQFHVHAWSSQVKTAKKQGWFTGSPSSMAGQFCFYMTGQAQRTLTS